MKAIVSLLLTSQIIYALDLSTNSRLGVYDVFYPREQQFVCQADVLFTREDLPGLYMIRMGKEGSLESEKGELFYKIEKPEELLITTVFHKPGVEEIIPIPISLLFLQGQVVAPGIYKGSFPYTILYQEKVQKEGMFRLSLTVDSQAEAMISDFITETFAKTKFVVWDFGFVDGPITRNAYMHIRTNHPFGLYLESTGRGKLTLQNSRFGNTYSPEETIPYRLLIGGQEIPLGLGSYHFDHLEQLFYNLSVTVYPNLAKNLAGTYKDQIFLTIVSNN